MARQEAMAQTTKPTILVIGADSHFCYLMRRYVRESAHPLLFAIPDEQAVSLATQERPALIVMESGPNAIFSRNLLPKLKTNASTSCIPVVLCSWNEDEYPASTPTADVHLRLPILYGDFLCVLGDLGI